jgi:hypothetical protein
MEMHQVRYFVAVSRTLNFTRGDRWSRPRSVSTPDTGELRALREAEREANAIGDAQASRASACEQTDRGSRERNVDIRSE